MKERKFLTSALFIAAAAMSFGVVSAQATEHELGDSRQVTGGNSDNFNSDSFIISSGTINSSNWGTTNHLGAWIVWAGVADNNNGGSLGTTTITGSGFLGLAVRYGANDCTADLTNVDASGFTGQLSVINTFAKAMTVKLSGDWSGTEYVFGSVTNEWAGGPTGTGSNSVPYYRGITGTGSTDTLALQDDTTLAGITGTSKGYTVNGLDVNSMEAITVATTGATLTLVGEGSYEFYGTVGAEELELSISMGYDSSSGSGDVGSVGSQTFGGTNYLDKVTVNEGTLKLGGTTSISGAASVASGAELDLSGTVTLGSAISNSGTVVVDSDVVFVLDKLTSIDGTYTIITNTNGGSITGWESLDYSNFSGVTSDRQITSSSNGSITIDMNESAHDLVWNGTSSGTWNNNVSDNNVWTNSGPGNSDYFVNGDNVTFNSSGSTSITISGDVKVGTMTVSNGSYTFTASGSDTLTVDSVSVNSSDAITFTGGGEFTITGDYTVVNSNSTQGASLTVGDGTSVTMKNYEAHYHQGTTTLGTGATLTVTTQMWFATNSTEELTGGTFNIGQLTISNYATVSIRDAVLNIGAGDANGGIKNDNGGHVEFGDNLTVGVYAGESGNNTGWSTTSEIQFTGTDNTSTTFSTKSGETITLGGKISGVGFTNTGEGTLVLSGSVALSGAIINSGNIEISSSVSFAVDDLTVNAYTDGKTSYYEIITGTDSGSVTFDGCSYSNFTLGGEILSSSWNIYTDNGYLVIYRSAKDLIWAGTGDSNEWNYTDANWNDGSTTTFAEGDNVTFGAIESGSPYGTVNITTSITAGTIAVNDDYKFVFTDGIKVEAQYVDVATNKTLKLELVSGASSAEFHMDGESFVDFFGGSENHGTVEIGSGVTFYLSDLNDSYTFNSNNTTGSVTGTGTLSIGTTGSNHELGLYLPGFQGTVIFREGTSAVRFGHSNDYDTGVFNSSATLVFESGVGLTLVGNTTDAVSAALVFEEGSHTIATNGDTAEFSGAIDATDAMITISGTGKLTFSGSVDIGTLTISSASTDTFSGGGSIGTLQLGGAATIVLTGNTTYTITEIAATAHANSTLEISEGTTVNAESLTANWHFETMQVDGVLNISGTAVFGTASVDTYVEHFTGSGIVTIGTLQIGHSNNDNGASIKIEGGITFIVGEVTSGRGTNHYVEIANATIGTNSDTLTFGADENKFVLSAEEGSATIFNTSKFDTTTNEFTDQAATITIAANITGEGAMKVTGNGKLILSGTSYLSSVTVDSGATLEIGGTIALSSAISNSGTIVINDGTTFALDNLTETYHADSTSYYEIIVSNNGLVTFSEVEGAYSFVYGGNTLSGWTIAQDGSGNIWIYGIVGEFTWAGTAANHNWSLQTSDQTWLIGGTDTGSFVNGSDATFGPITEGSPSATVNITESLTAGIVTVQDDYTFVLSNGVTLEATYIDVLSKEGEYEGNYKLTLQVANSGDTATVLMDSENFYQFFTGQENQGDIEIGAGVTFYLSTLVNDSASVTSASFSITGTGTLSVGATRDSDNYGQIGLYLPDFEGTVVFREGTTYARFGLDNGSYTGVFNASATLVFEAGVGMSIQSDLTVTGEDNAQEDHRILASIEFEEGSHEIATGGHTAEFAGTVSGEKADITITGAGTLTFSGDSVSFGSLTFSGASSGAAATIEVGAGTTFTVTGNVIDTTGNEMVHITLGEESTMIVGGMIAFSPGSAGSYDSIISGAGANSSTIVVGELVVGGTAEDSGGSAIEVSDVTLVVGALSFGNGVNSNFDLYLKDMTLGFTNDMTITETSASTANSPSTSRLVLGEYGTGNSTTTGSGTTTTINTSRYDVETGAFTNEGVTVTISQIIYGKGDLVVEGVGKLVLTAANEYTSSTTIKDGATVVVQNESALGTGSVSVESGGTLELDAHVSVTTSSDVTFASGASIVLGGDLLDSILGLADTCTAVAVITANTITFGDVSVSGYSDDLSSLINDYVSVNGYELTWSWSTNDNTLYVSASIVPEPGMFSLFAGLGALGLIATRRRRKAA